MRLNLNTVVWDVVVVEGLDRSKKIGVVASKECEVL